MTLPVITTFNIGYMQADLDQWFKLPGGHPNSGQVAEIPMLCHHIAHAGRSVLVDATRYDFPAGYEQYAIPAKQQPSLLEQLAARHIQPEDISDVVITHAHFDHYNGLSLADGDGYRPAFPNARHYLGIGDYNPADFGGLETRTLKLVHDLGLLTLVEAPLELGAGITILPAPGESPGHQIVHVHVNIEHAYITGDLYHHPLEFADTGLNVYWTTPEMPASKQELMRAAAGSGAKVYFSHISGPHTVRAEGKKLVWERI
ncbi:MAG: MBL fold metallo-hydrolase [Chloroflexi bacterium]|nr:MBL fold metallo-hydrolase [Chloroflexota bacterium]